MGILRAICFTYLLLFAAGLLSGLWRETAEDDSTFTAGLVAILAFVVAAFILYR